MGELPRSYRELQDEHPEVADRLEALGAAAAEAGPLPASVRELIKLGMAAGTGSESAVHSHTHRALESGATEEEIRHAILLGVTTLGFPRMMAGLSWAKAAFDAHRPGTDRP